MAPPEIPDTLIRPFVVMPSLLLEPVSEASANVGIDRGVTGPTTFDQSLSPMAFTARTRNQY